MCITKNIKQLKNKIPSTVTLVAVSKTKPVEDILEAYATDHYDFGENKVQEMIEKYNKLPKDINWHMIGHLQTNKVKYIAPFIDLIHSVDSLKLLKEINKRGLENKRTIKCLLQIQISKEVGKFGVSYKNAISILQESKLLSNVNIIGLMGMATFTNNKNEIEIEFENLNYTYTRLQQDYTQIKILSMGMSQDYKIAIKQGSNMIRLGSTIFGKRKNK
ncbi:MAG: YggS family pyridoxal phosphate-dependent enzyme [Bacteroidota bacterium]|nr:YggS family pyridoxal phosphate-dependent enzyme [Bacteroidota bacterium]